MSRIIAIVGLVISALCVGVLALHVAALPGWLPYLLLAAVFVALLDRTGTA